MSKLLTQFILWSIWFEGGLIPRPPCVRGKCQSLGIFLLTLMRILSLECCVLSTVLNVCMQPSVKCQMVTLCLDWQKLKQMSDQKDWRVESRNSKQSWSVHVWSFSLLGKSQITREDLICKISRRLLTGLGFSTRSNPPGQNRVPGAEVLAKVLKLNWLSYSKQTRKAIGNSQSHKQATFEWHAEVPPSVWF